MLVQFMFNVGNFSHYVSISGICIYNENNKKALNSVKQSLDLIFAES